MRGRVRIARNRVAPLLPLHAVVPYLQQFLRWRHRQWAHDAEAQPLRVRVIPLALRELRVLLLPGRLRGPPGGAAQHGHFLVLPTAAARDMRVRRGRLNPAPGRLELGVALFVILVETPLDDVAVDVVQAPWIRFLAANFLIFEIAVAVPPGELANVVGRTDVESGLLSQPQGSTVGHIQQRGALRACATFVSCVQPLSNFHWNPRAAAAATAFDGAGEFA